MNKIDAAFENNPALGWWGTLVSWFFAFIGWLAAHAGQLGQMIGIVCAVFGALASYYTFKIQKRRWKREETRRRDYE